MEEGMPYTEAHNLLLVAGNLFADEDWEREEHISLFEEFYPPQCGEDQRILDQTCMGKKVNQEKIEEARNARRNLKNL